MSDAHLDDAERIFHEALEIAPQRRAEFIERQTAGNPALRAEIELLLQADLDAATVGFPSPSVWLPPDTLTTGQIVAERYRLLRPIGEGGLGTVWSAEQIAPVERRVAIKFIRHDLNGRQVVARFAAERAALALMDHPGIARIIDAGVWDAGVWDAGVRIDRAANREIAGDPRPYVVMELVDGPPITIHCDRGQLPIRERVRLVAEICRAVHHAHQKGILHRDLKPSNILTTLVDGVAVPKVIDFGIAKALGDDVLPDRTMTRAGQFVGTPAYMAPEQLRGDAANTDVRADIFALGVVLHELLAGCLPHDRSSSGMLSPSSNAAGMGSTVVRTPSSSVRRLGAEDLTRVAAARGESPRSLRRRLKGELDWIVGRATAPEPERRYGSANEFAADLDRWLAEEPVVAGPPSVRYRARKFVQRNTAAVVIGGVLALALVAGLVGTSTGLIRANAAEIAARQARVDAERAAESEATQRAEAVAAQRRAELNAYRAEFSAASAAIIADEIPTAQDGLAGTDPALRGWEWRRLAFVTEQSEMIIRPEAGRIFGIALTPEESEVVFTCADGSLRSLDAETGEPRIRVDLGLSAAVHLAIAPRGDRAVVCGFRDDELTIPEFALIEWPAGVLIARGRGWTTNACFSPDGRRFVASDHPGVGYRLFDSATGADLATIDADTVGISGFAFFVEECEQLMISDIRTGAMALVDPAGRTTRRWQMPRLDRGTPFRGGFFAGADWSTGHATVLRHEDPQWQRIIRSSVPRGPLRDVVISPDGRLAAASSSQSGTIHLHDLDLDRTIALLRGHQNRIVNFAFTSDSRRLYTASEDGTVRRWRLDSVSDEFRIEPNSGSGELAADFSADASLLASSGWGSIELWDTGTGALRWTAHATNRFVDLIRFSPDDRRLIVAERQGGIRILSTEDGAVIQELAPLGANPTAIAWDPLDRFVAIADDRGSLHFVDPTGAAPTVKHELSNDPISALELSPDGTLFAAGTGLTRRWTGSHLRFMSDSAREPELLIGRIGSTGRTGGTGGTALPRRYRLSSGVTSLAFAADVGSSSGSRDGSESESESESALGHLYVGSVTGWLIALQVDAELSATEVPGQRWSIDGAAVMPPVGAFLDVAGPRPASRGAAVDGSSSVVAILPWTMPGRIVVSLQNGTTSVLVAGVEAPVLRFATAVPRAIVFEPTTETLMVSGRVPLQSFGIAHPTPELVAARDRVVAIRAVVDPLVSRHRMTDAVLRAIDADPTIDDGLRADAASYARARGEHLAWVVSDAIEVARKRATDDATVARHRQALEQLDHVAEQWRVSPGRFGFVRAVLLMRLGEYAAAGAELDLQEQARPTTATTATTATTDLDVLSVRALLALRQGDDATAMTIWSVIRARIDEDGPPSGEAARYVLEAELEFERSPPP